MQVKIKFLLIDWDFKATVDLSALITQGKVTTWQFDADHSDQVVGHAIINNGQTTLTVPVMGALLVKF